MKFPNIEKLGLRIVVGPSGKPEVSADELEIALKNISKLSKEKVHKCFMNTGLLTEFDGFGFERYIDEFCKELGL